MKTIVLTGFPGFLGSRLLPSLLGRAPDRRAVCLVQEKFAHVAEARRLALEEEHPEIAGRVELVGGDITVAGLGLESDGTRDVVEIYHLAAVYDLMVERPLAVRVNVDGTRNVLDFAESCPGLERLHYVSTCYVSGRYAGIFGEDDLDKGQTFNNYYEETKFLAEVEVKARMDRGLPATVYRPAVVVGDSRTGETQKFDGPYFVIRWLLRQGRIATLPVVGDPTATTVNLVPSDFVLDAIAQLSALDRSLGKTYQLADPDPLTVDALIDAIARETERRVVRIPLPRSLAKAALDHLPGMYRLMRIPSASVDYFVHPTHYSSDRARADLAGSGVAVPPFVSYLPALVRFVREHPEIGSAAMI